MFAQIIAAVALSVIPAPSHIGEYNLVTGVTHPNEDEIGWNCFTDGNKSCGNEGVVKARGFDRAGVCVWYKDAVVNHGRYVMCKSGAVYVRNWSR